MKRWFRLLKERLSKKQIEMWFIERFTPPIGIYYAWPFIGYIYSGYPFRLILKAYLFCLIKVLTFHRFKYEIGFAEPLETNR